MIAHLFGIVGTRDPLEEGGFWEERGFVTGKRFTFWSWLKKERGNEIGPTK